MFNKDKTDNHIFATSRVIFATTLLVVAAACFGPRIATLANIANSKPPVGKTHRDVSRLSRAANTHTVPIEAIRCGDRVYSDLPAGVQPKDEAVPDPATWRLVELSVTKNDGSVVLVKLLRPLKWLEQAGALRSGTFSVNLEELGIDGNAAVLKLLPCPAIQPGSGEIVTGTFRHTCNDLIELDVDGLSDPIICTSGHPIWSKDRQTFVPAARLKLNERLELAVESGTGRLIASRSRNETVDVFNLEIARTHVYHVGDGGLLAHNNNLKKCGVDDGPDASQTAIRLGLPRGRELTATARSSLDARKQASVLVGLGDDAVDFVSDVGPQSGWITGRQSKDGLRGWRMDWDPKKGYHVNWWDHTEGKKRPDWVYGAIEIEGGSWDDYIELLQHGFGNR